MRCRFESVKGLLQFADMVRVVGVDVVFKLVHIDILLDIRLREGGVDVGLLHGPIEAGSQVGDDADYKNFVVGAKVSS